MTASLTLAGLCRVGKLDREFPDIGAIPLNCHCASSSDISESCLVCILFPVTLVIVQVTVAVYNERQQRTDGKVAVDPRAFIWKLLPFTVR